MHAENQEFKELLESSGWSQSEAARRLDLPPPSISRYVNDVDRPSKQTLRLFKIILSSENPETLGPAGTLRETAGESDLDLWRRRAKAAEKELAEIKTTLRALATAPSAQRLAQEESLSSGQTNRHDQIQDTGAGKKMREIFERRQTPPPDKH